MRNTLHNADRGSEPAEKDPLNGATPRPLGRRTAAAGSEFLKALGSDLAALAAQLEELLTVMRERLASTSAAAIAAMLALAARLRQLLTAMRKRLASTSAPAAISALAARLGQFPTANRQWLAGTWALTAMATLAARLGQFPTAKRERRARPSAPAVATMSARVSRAYIRGQLLRRLGLGIVLTALSAALTLSCAMLWALHDAPLDKPVIEPDKPALLLEAGNGPCIAIWATLL